MAIVSLLLLNGLCLIVPGADGNIDPNNPEDPAAQAQYNYAAIQARVSNLLRAALPSEPVSLRRANWL